MHVQTMPNMGCNMYACIKGVLGYLLVSLHLARKQARCMHEWFVLKGLCMITLAIRHILTPIMRASHGQHPIEVVDWGARKYERARKCARPAIPPLTSAMAPRFKWL